MLVNRYTGGLIALLGAVLPSIALWQILVAVIRREAARPAPATPNPAKAPASWLGPAEVLVYADPCFAGTIHLWLLPGAILEGSRSPLLYPGGHPRGSAPGLSRGALRSPSQGRGIQGGRPGSAGASGLPVALDLGGVLDYDRAPSDEGPASALRKEMGK
jgi:hypothetical protein